MTDDDRLAAAREHFGAGLAQLHAGALEAAESAFRASLALLPGRVSTLLNLAVTLLQQGRPADALPLLDQALAQQPDDADALGHRGLALNGLRRHHEAAAVFERLTALAPQRPEAWFHRAQTLQTLGQPGPALAAYDRCVALQPGHGQAWSQRGSALKDLGRRDEAAASYERAIGAGADPVLNGYCLAALRGGGPVPPAAPRTFVERLFDDYAEGFDRHLVDTLEYRAPEVLARLLVGAGAARFASALDLGCGTGLCGPALRPMVQRLHGVDLSPAMLERARERGCYDALTQADLGAHLRTTDERHDLVVAADVFIYVGDLSDVFDGVRRVLLRGGLFAFSVEAAASAAQWVLQPSLHYAHGEPYLRDLAAAHGLPVLACERGVLRLDQRRDVVGLYCVLRAAR